MSANAFGKSLSAWNKIPADLRKDVVANLDVDAASSKWCGCIAVHGPGNTPRARDCDECRGRSEGFAAAAKLLRAAVATPQEARRG